MKLAKHLTTKMIKYHLINVSDEDLYIYGLINGFIIFINLLTVTILSAFLKKQDEVLILLISFIPLRSFCGGFHCKTQIACYIISNIVIITLLEMQYFLMKYKLLLLFLCILSSIYIIVKDVKSSPNRRIDKYESHYFKIVKKRILYVLLVSLVLLILIGKVNYAINIITAIILVAILLFWENIQTYINRKTLM